MNQNVLKTLEYPKIKQQVNSFLVTESGKKELNDLKPIDDPKIIQQWLDETDDGYHLLRLNSEIPVPVINDIIPYMKRIKIQASLNGNELSQISKILNSVNQIASFFDKLRNEKVTFNRLYELVQSFKGIPSVANQLRTSISDDGYLLDSASSELHHIRKIVARMQNMIRTRMNHFTNGKNVKYLSEPIITIRDDRYVIPIKAEYKQKFGGIIHDQSSSGQTLYVEPSSVIKFNNELRRDQLAEKQEERKVLAELSDLIRPYQNEIINNYRVLGHLDLINAKAKYARLMKSTKPVISKQNHVNLRKARHPLIDAKKVVANDVILGDKYKTIIITGPNTGGKTITIKMLGLLQLMGQSGLFITANENSQIGVFDQVFADIGDDQSIEQNLSTFSSHMDNIVKILHHITNQSLVLLDEVGAGTDPKEGAYLAISILDYISQVDSEVVATTHYPELKVYGYNRPKTENASMEFNTKTLQPTYHLLLGVPGQSNGLNIAERLGLDQMIIKEAQGLTSDSSQDINNMIKQLAEQTRLVRRRADKLRQNLNDATNLYHQLKNKYGQYENQRDRLNVEAKEKANDIVKDTKRKVDQIIHRLHVKEKQLASSPVKENELIDAKGDVNSLKQDVSLKHNHVLNRAKAQKKRQNELKVGDDVMVTTYGQRGVLISHLSRNTWEVQIGILKMRVSSSNLKKINPPKEKSTYTGVRRTSSSGLSTKLDLRGERYEEAMHRVDRFIDEALLAGYPMVTIIHGKGTGALRTGVNQYLKQNSRVKSFGYAPANAGGDGSTIVKFK
ncbi:endonuclease MutS2 [Philodulcilactobacillus myokoensis]|uniref:Endonuclease MutS2 n=1 Tax=Philodulcilactobacillus myokoensis TaxID=2929573 RepID=A0A9W6EST5_9LACO|nr:endonuclease MutS2 [Philodulcilactobacillus myokoensis]GLB46688.1 endonuclease MutS2 [Philodulcilactobacillus myokoensis]